MKKALIFLLCLFTSLFCCFITTMIIDKRVDSIEEYKKLVIEEVAEIYGSDAYIYSIEELELETENEYAKYCCLIKFYDGETYVERIMYVNESGNVYTEVVLEEIENE